MADQQSTHELAIELSSLKAEMRGELKGIATSIDSIHRQLDSVVAMRDEITRMASNYEQWRTEKQTMWNKMDAMREDIDKLQETQHKTEGATKLARWLFTAVSTALVGAVGYLWNDHTEIQLLKQRMGQMEVRK